MRLLSKNSLDYNQNRQKKVGILTRPRTISPLEAKILQKRDYMKVHLSYPIKDMSYASIGDDTVWPFESTGPIVG